MKKLMNGIQMNGSLILTGVEVVHRNSNSGRF